jgi:hypothetical protein
MATTSSQIGGQLWKPGALAPTTIGGKTYTPVAYYPSSSGNTKPGMPQGYAYTVCEVSDGTTSCDCPGWTKRNPPGGRTCKHTQDYEMFLRPQWQQMNSGAPAPAPSSPTRAAVRAAASPPVQAPDREKGGTLADLFAKLEKGGLHGS